MKSKFAIILFMLLTSCRSISLYEKPALNIPELEIPVMEIATKDNLIQALSNNFKKLQVYSLNQKEIIKAYKDYYESKK